MFRNYFKIAWRNLKGQAFYTFLNTFGLAIGMAGALLISLYLYDELSFDKMFSDSDRIHRINADVKFGGEEFVLSEASAPMAEALQKDYPQVELTTRFRIQGSMLIRKTGSIENVKESNSAFVDSTFFEMFGIELISGDAMTSLRKPNTLIMTKTAAEKHFNIEDAIGQTVLLNNNDVYELTGIIDDLPKNSFLRNHDAFMAISGYDDAQQDLWGNHNYATFFKLAPDASVENFQASLQSMVGRYVIPFIQRFFPGITEEEFIASGNYLNFTSIPLTDIHLHSNRAPEMSPNGNIQNIYIFSFIALFLIILASVNFMNLSTARSLKRAKEVGIRKTLGSSKADLVRQFLTESGLISFLSLLVAIAIAYFAMPFFNELADKEISIPFTNPLFIIGLLFCAIILGLLSGIYPAFFMSRFNPVKVLKGSKISDKNGGNIRNGLVILQFGISVFLIVSTLVVYQQLQFIQNKELGYQKDHIVIIEDVYAAGDQLETFKQEVQSLAQVENSSISSFLPTNKNRSSSSFFREGSREQENALNMQNWVVDYDYISTLDIELLAGRNFEREYGTDSSAMILNESALATLGVSAEEALGLRLSSSLGEENPEYSTVIGVIKNYHFETLREDISALSLSLGSSNGSMAVKIQSDNISSTISSIKDKWNGVALGQPFNYYFLEESFNEIYQTELRLGKIFIIFTMLSILIACLGLFGLAALNTERRTKEIGIRKVLGASVSQISIKLTMNFLKLVGISILIALPLAYLVMNKWLEDFSYRMEMGWGIFIITIVLVLGISILTVSYQSISAALTNPLKNLRTE